jgi:hypothetical protein
MEESNRGRKEESKKSGRPLLGQDRVLSKPLVFYAKGQCEADVQYLWD